MSSRGKVQLIVLLIGAAVLVWFFARRFERSRLYHPQAFLEATPKDIGLQYRDVTFLAEDGTRLHGWWIPAVSPRGALLFCHGNAGNVSHNLENLRVFHELEMDVLIFDYRGYGRSSGRPSEAGTYRDARAAYEYLITTLKVPRHQLAIYGMSLGGAVAIQLALEKPAAALICESTFTSAENLARRFYPYLPVKLLVFDEYDSLSKVGNLTLPKLFIHSPVDELVPFSDGQRLYQAAAPPKEFLEIRGPHGEGAQATGQSYVRGMGAFLDSVLR